MAGQGWPSVTAGQGKGPTPTRPAPTTPSHTVRRDWSPPTPGRLKTALAAAAARQRLPPGGPPPHGQLLGARPVAAARERGRVRGGGDGERGAVDGGHLHQQCSRQRRRPTGPNRRRGLGRRGKVARGGALGMRRVRACCCGLGNQRRPAAAVAAARARGCPAAEDFPPPPRQSRTFPRRRASSEPSPSPPMPVARVVRGHPSGWSPLPTEVPTATVRLRCGYTKATPPLAGEARARSGPASHIL